ncbi:hypothetical protein V0M98_32610 (plasmid) [Pseudomonas silesiensis]|uniref:hypothetical protein n=1 Tax=Pseudomonas silesiensis TaxID=1853130 RepID=UPI0030D33C20
MAMNKKERDYVEQLEARLALRHTAPVEYDIDPDSVTVETFGFTRAVVNLGYYWPKKAVTTKSRHGSCEVSSEKPPQLSSQTGWHLHSTRADALREMRYQIEQKAADMLHRIDLEILKEVETPTNPRGEK